MTKTGFKSIRLSVLCVLVIALACAIPKAQSAEDPFTDGTQFTPLSTIWAYSIFYMNVVNDRQFASSFTTNSARENVSFDVNYIQFFSLDFKQNQDRGDIPRRFVAIFDNKQNADGIDLPNRQVVLFRPNEQNAQYEKESGGKLHPNTKYWVVIGVREEDVDHLNSYVLTMTQRTRHASLWRTQTLPRPTYDPAEQGSEYPFYVKRERVKVEDENGNLRFLEWGDWFLPPYNSTDSIVSIPSDLRTDLGMNFAISVTPMRDDHRLLAVSSLSTNRDNYDLSGVNAHGDRLKRAISFFTGDDYYGVTYKAKYVVLNYRKESGIYPNPKPRVYYNTREGLSSEDAPTGRPGKKLGDFTGNGYWQGSFNGDTFFRRMNTSRTMRFKPYQKYWIEFSSMWYPEPRPGEWAYYIRFYRTRGSWDDKSPHGWSIGDREMVWNDNESKYEYSGRDHSSQFGLMVKSLSS